MGWLGSPRHDSSEHRQTSVVDEAHFIYSFLTLLLLLPVTLPEVSRLSEKV